MLYVPACRFSVNVPDPAAPVWAVPPMHPANPRSAIAAHAYNKMKQSAGAVYLTVTVTVCASRIVNGGVERTALKLS